MMIDINKQYRTRDGREVRIYATDGTNDQNIHGATKESEGWMVRAWYRDGVYARSDPNGKRDLIEVRPRHKRTVWVTVWRNGYTETSSKPEWRNGPLGCDEGPVACIKVDLDFEEGEGL